jgi:hypothetical protein
MVNEQKCANGVIGKNLTNQTKQTKIDDYVPKEKSLVNNQQNTRVAFFGNKLPQAELLAKKRKLKASGISLGIY